MKKIILLLVILYIGYAGKQYLVDSDISLAKLFELQGSATPTAAHYDAIDAVTKKDIRDSHEAPNMSGLERDYERLVDLEDAKRKTARDIKQRSEGVLANVPEMPADVVIDLDDFVEQERQNKTQ